MKLPFLKTIIITISTILVLIILHYLLVLQPIENFIINAAGFVGSNIYKLSALAGNKIDSSATGRTDREDALIEQLNKLIIENAGLKVAQTENETLRKELSFVNTQKLKYVVANVIGHRTELNISGIIIDKGTNDGISDGLAVVTNGNIIMGKISYAKPSSSEVLLLNDNHSKLIAATENQSQITGIIEGQFSLGLKMTLIPITEKIKKDDVVVTAGFEENIPKGLVVGQIADVQTLPTDLFQSAIVRIPVDNNNVTIVAVILP